MKRVFHQWYDGSIMKKKAKKIMIIEDLATLMQSEFLAMHEKMDAGFLSVDEQLNEIRQEISNVSVKWKI